MRTMVLLCSGLLTACSDASVTKFNAGPDAVITSHSDGDAVNQGAPIALRGQVSDPDHDTDSLSTTWLIDGVEACPETSPDDGGLVTCEVIFDDATATGKIVLEVRDPESKGASDQVLVDVQEATPEGSVRLEPTSLYTNDIVTAVVSVSVPYDEEPEMLYTFTVDGIVTQEGISETLDGALHFDKGQAVNVSVTVTSSAGESTVTATPITVQNAEPGVPGVIIDNTPACGEGWTMMPGEDRCVLAVADTTEWNIAEMECIAYGGNLVRIGSATDAAFLFDLYTTETGLTGNYWAGYTDLDEEGVWTWTDGGPTTYTNWGAGEPNNLWETGEHCLQITESGEWNDLGCDDTADTLQGYICQVSSRATELTCVIEDESVDDDEDPITYTIGWDIDGDPVDEVITTVIEGDTVSADLLELGEVLTCTVTPNDGEVDGPPGVATHTMVDCDADGDGFESESDGCGGDDCDDSDPTVNPIGGDTYGDGIDSDCDDLDCEAASDGSTYFALCGPNRWEDAAMECTSRGLTFGSIRSDEENEFVAELMRGSDLYFSPDSVVGEAVWIGFTDAESEGSFVWEDGYTGGYTNWFPGEPNDFEGQDCAYMDVNPASRNGKWDDAGCGEVGGERVFLCTRR